MYCCVPKTEQGGCELSCLLMPCPCRGCLGRHTVCHRNHLAWPGTERRASPESHCFSRCCPDDIGSCWPRGSWCCWNVLGGRVCINICHLGLCAVYAVPRIRLCPGHLVKVHCYLCQEIVASSKCRVPSPSSSLAPKANSGH